LADVDAVAAVTAVDSSVLKSPSHASFLQPDPIIDDVEEMTFEEIDALELKSQHHRSSSGGTSGESSAAEAGLGFLKADRPTDMQVCVGECVYVKMHTFR
jgi:hypothetical protein